MSLWLMCNYPVKLAMENDLKEVLEVLIKTFTTS
jgi:hypothetical protein